MKILLTNDDGIEAQGLLALRRALSTVAETAVVAPSEERSGVAHGVTIGRPVAVERVSFDGTVAYAVHGTPVDCVKIAIKGMAGEQPALVFSGINVGSNVGIDVIYSGTVSAALEAAIMGVPSVAVSLARPSSDFSYAAKFAAKLARMLLRDPFLPPGVLLNVNVPHVPEDRIGGVLVTKQSKRCYGEEFELEEVSSEKSLFTLSGKLIGPEEAEDMDVTALARHHVSVTPIHFDLTHYPSLEALLRQKIVL